MRWLRLLLILLALALPGEGSAQAQTANPFQGERAAQPTAGATVETGPIATIGRLLVQFQREANRQIGLTMRAIRDGESPRALLVALGLAFLYGVLHAAGPGHGKMVVIGYFLAREAQIARGLLMGAQIAVFHVLSAMVVVLLADLLLRRAFGGPPAEIVEIRLASYGLIALIGTVMLVQAVRRSLRPSPAAHDHDHTAGCGCHASPRQQGLLALGVGLVPCTGAVLILLYALANDILAAGLLLVGMIALGMAVTMGLLGLLSVVARGFVAARLEGGGAPRLALALDYAGALAITTVGLTLLLTAA